VTKHKPLIFKGNAKPSLGLENPEVQWGGEREGEFGEKFARTRDAARSSGPRRIRQNPAKREGFSIPQREV
jgi:hypothetical protein